jgi:hypothetical protein
MVCEGSSLRAQRGFDTIGSDYIPSLPLIHDALREAFSEAIPHNRHNRSQNTAPSKFSLPTRLFAERKVDNSSQHP